MDARCMLRVIATSAAITAAGLYCPEPLRGVIGISAASAKEFYTRKRVNGRWITGRFAKRHTREARNASLEARSRPIHAGAPPPVAEVSASPFSSVAAPSSPVPVASLHPGTVNSRENPVIPATPDEVHLDDLKRALQARASKLAEGAV